MSISLAEGLCAGPEPLKRATDDAQHILVLGAGVTGLVNAWFLLDRGFRVTIVSKAWASFGMEKRLTSQVAGALWELPPTQCGRVSNDVAAKLSPEGRDRLQKWAVESFPAYAKMASHEELSRTAGVKMKMCTSFFTSRLTDDEFNFDKMEKVKQILPGGLYWGKDLMEKYGVNSNVRGGLQDAYEHDAPVIDTDKAMAFLIRLVAAKGAKMHTTTIVGDLLEKEQSLLKLYGADLIINSAGLAGELAADSSVFPVRGALLRVINDGSSFPKIENATIISAETKDGQIQQGMAFIVPRSDNILVLGSIEQLNEDELDLTLNSEGVKQIRRRCEDLLPVLKTAQLDEAYPLAQGLRPYRYGGARVERESRRLADGSASKVVHCYGHGGGGWSVAFGSARECANLVDDILHSL